jgi:hypothetical protein
MCDKIDKFNVQTIISLGPGTTNPVSYSGLHPRCSERTSCGGGKGRRLDVRRDTLRCQRHGVMGGASLIRYSPERSLTAYPSCEMLVMQGSNPCPQDKNNVTLSCRIGVSPTATYHICSAMRIREVEPFSGRWLSKRGWRFYFKFEKECCDMAEMRESNKLVVKVDVDVSDALKGLKALRREANKTLKALEKVQQKANEINILEYAATVTMQDAMDSEQFAEEIRKEIEEHKKEMEERRKAFRERFETARERIDRLSK